jgi:lipopolysaccharide assembly protein A
MSIKMILALILTGVAVVFIVQNAQVGELRFLVWTLAVSQALLLFFTLAVGIVCGWMLHAWFAHQRAKRRTHSKVTDKAQVS